MADESFEVIRETTCSTCLSQNRRLFPIKDSNLFTMLNLNIAVTEEDKMCWECRYAVMKMISFKNQAQKAKATLTALANKKICNIQSLSRLSRSPEVKINVLNESNDDGELVCKEEPNSAEDMFEVVGNDNLFEHVDVEPYVEASVEDGTRNWLSECEIDVLESKHVTKKVNKTRTRKNQSYESDDTIFSVEKMTEKNMQHWRKRKKEMEFYTDSTFKCKKCVEPMENITFYGAHKKRHTNKVYGKIICCVCMLRFPNDAALDLHSKTHYRLLKCKLCAHEWDSANGMRLHCREAHGVPVTAWGCELCPREFRSPNKLTVHMRCHRSLTCPECGITLRSSLKKHMNRQHPELPLRRCFICNQQFRGDSGLKVHMEKHINPVEDATFCVECNMEFRNKYVYRSHMRNTVRHAAAEDLRFKCPECGKGFLDHFSLTNHMDAMHDKRKKYKCESCGQAFTTVVARRNHKRRLHEGRLPPRDKICDYCGKAFQTRVILLQHVNSHTGARPYKCKLCDATFGYKSALYLHGRFVHKIKKKT